MFCRVPNICTLALYVTDPESIRHAVDAAWPLDVLVNNAGIGVLNALEGTSMDIAREVFETNTLGTIAMTGRFCLSFGNAEEASSSTSARV